MSYQEDDPRDAENKPRKLEEDDEVVTYLKSLDERLSEEGLDQADAEVLAENVLTEIKTRTASAACDRRTNLIIEKLSQACSLPNLLQIIERFSPYAEFLASNRYSSHVIQTITARLCYIFKYESGVEDDNYTRIIIEFVKPILANMSNLIKDISGTHVIRSCISLLAGMPAISERKGKGSKHQHSVSLSQTLESTFKSGTFQIDKSICFPVPDEFHELLGEAMAGMLALEPTDIHALLAETSASAVLGLLVRVLSTPDLVQGGVELVQRFVMYTLEWEDVAETAKDSRTSKLFYAMAGDRAASYFLQSAVESCDIEMVTQLVQSALLGAAHEYAHDAIGNFVLQSVLKRLCVEVCAKASNLPESPSDADKMLSLAEALIVELLQEAHFKDLVTRRGGVVMWMIDLACELDKCNLETEVTSGNKENKQDSDGEEAKSKKCGWGQRVGSAVLNMWLEMYQVDSESAKESAKVADLLESRLRKIEQEKTEGRAETNARNKRPGSGREDDSREKDSAQLLFARTLGSLLKLTGTKTARSVSTAISKLSSEVILHIGCSGPTSRAVFDTFFSHHVSAKDLKKLLETIATLVADLGMHFCGQHVIRQAFDVADIGAKERLAQAAVSEKETLNRSKEGRATLRNVHAELYSREPEGWRQLMRKHAKGVEMLKELEGDPFGPAAGAGAYAGGKKGPSAEVYESSHVGNAESRSESQTETAGRKRKRKRPNAKATITKFHDSDDEAKDEADSGDELESGKNKGSSNDDTNGGEKKPKKAKEAVTDDHAVDDIFAALEKPAANKMVTESGVDSVAEQPKKKSKSLKYENHSEYKKEERKDRDEWRHHGRSKDKDSNRKRKSGDGHSSKGRADMDKIKNLKSAKLLSTAALGQEINQLMAEKSRKH
jgi:hypothetical protein